MTVNFKKISQENILQQKVIGGEEKYMAVCRACFNLPDITSPHKVLILL